MVFSLKINNKQDYTIFYLTGNLNYDGAKKLFESFTEQINKGNKKIILNLQDLKIIQSYALSVILKISFIIKEQKGFLAIICPKGNIWDVFYVLEIYKIIPFFESEEEFWKNENKIS